MSIIFKNYEDQSSQSIILREGLPTQRELQRQVGSGLFKKYNKKQIDDSQKKGLCSTQDCIQNGQEELKIKQKSVLNNICSKDDMLELCSNPSSMIDQFQIFQREELAESQILNQPQLRTNKSKSSKSKKKKIYGNKIYKAQSQTKNIPKNYGKQIIRFIKTKKVLIKNILNKLNSEISYQTLLEQLKKKKKTLNKIQDLRKLWLQCSYSKQFRIFSALFLRKYSLSWIFNSRIQNTKYPVKYRYRLIQGVHNPTQFIYMKEY